MITRYDHRSVELQDEHTEQAWSAYRQSDMPEILDGYHKAVVLAALMRTGVLQRLREGRTDLGDLLGTLDPYFGEKLLRWLSTAGYTRRVEGGYAPTEAGAALLSDTALAQLSFYIEAYGPVTQRIEDLLRGTAHYGRDIQRDGAALGRSCNILFDLYHIDVVLEAFARRSATCALDLGCGAAASSSKPPGAINSSTASGWTSRKGPSRKPPSAPWRREWPSGCHSTSPTPSMQRPGRRPARGPTRSSRLASCTSTSARERMRSLRS
ncbi:hypothetical protein GCM10020295_37650 [Streptomyces cinereospinus]